MLAALLLAVVQPEPDPRPRPAELMQASRCMAEAERSPYALAPQLQPVETVPPCLAAIFAELASAARTIAGPEAETVLLSVKVARGFSQAVLLHGSAGDPLVHYAIDMGPVPAILGREWDHYRSPDGDLGWSGFLLVLRADRAEVRAIEGAGLAGFYDEAVRLEAEFFPGKSVASNGE